jgi:hypothetical protein
VSLYEKNFKIFDDVNNDSMNKNRSQLPINHSLEHDLTFRSDKKHENSKMKKSKIFESKNENFENPNLLSSQQMMSYDQIIYENDSKNASTVLKHNISTPIKNKSLMINHVLLKKPRSQKITLKNVQPMIKDNNNLINDYINDDDTYIEWQYRSSQNKSMLKDNIEKVLISKLENSKKPNKNSNPKQCSTSINDNFSQLSDDEKEKLIEILDPIFQVYESKLPNPENQIGDFQKSDFVGGEEKENNLNLFGGQRNPDSNSNSILFSDEIKSQDMKTNEIDTNDNTIQKDFYEELNNLMHIEEESKIMNMKSIIQKLDTINNLDLLFYFKILKPLWKINLNKIRIISTNWANKYFNTIDQYIRLKRKRNRNEIPRTMRIKIPTIRCNYDIGYINDFSTEIKDLELKIFDEILKTKEKEINIIPKLFQNKIESIINDTMNDFINFSKNYNDIKYKILYNGTSMNELSDTNQEHTDINLNHCISLMYNFFNPYAIKTFQDYLTKIKNKSLKEKIKMDNKLKQRNATLELIDETINETKMETIEEIIKETATNTAKAITEEYMTKRKYKNKKRYGYNQKYKESDNDYKRTESSNEEHRVENNMIDMNIHKNYQNNNYKKHYSYPKRIYRRVEIKNDNYSDSGMNITINNRSKYRKIEKGDNEIKNNDEMKYTESKERKDCESNSLNDSDFQICNQDILVINKACSQTYPQGLHPVNQNPHHYSHHQYQKMKWRIKNQNTNSSI